MNKSTPALFVQIFGTFHQITQKRLVSGNGSRPSPNSYKNTAFLCHIWLSALRDRSSDVVKIRRRWIVFGFHSFANFTQHSCSCRLTASTRFILSLFGFEVSVDDSQAVEMIQSQRQLCQVELHVLLCEHHLRGKKELREEKEEEEEVLEEENQTLKIQKNKLRRM